MKVNAIIHENVIDASERFKQKKRSDSFEKMVNRRKEKHTDQDYYARIFKRAIRNALKGRWNDQLVTNKIKSFERMSPLETIMDHIPLTAQQDRDPIKRRAAVFAMTHVDLIKHILDNERLKLSKVQTGLDKHEEKVPYPSLIQQDIDMYTRENEMFTKAIDYLEKRYGGQS